MKNRDELTRQEFTLRGIATAAAVVGLILAFTGHVAIGSIVAGVPIAAVVYPLIRIQNVRRAAAAEQLASRLSEMNAEERGAAVREFGRRWGMQTRATKALEAEAERVESSRELGSP